MPTADTTIEVAITPIADRIIWSDLRQARQAARNETPTPAPPPARVEGNPGYAVQGASTAILVVTPQPVAAMASVAQVTTGYGFLSPQGTGANYFRVLPVAELSVAALTNLLQSRTAYKKELFSDAIAQLALNPEMADVPSCADGVGGLAGTCLLQPEGREADKAMQSTSVDRTRVEERTAPHPARRIAVLFGLDQYQDKRIPQLTNAVSDASAVGAALARKMGFETRVLPNATKAEVIAQLNRLVEETAVGDSVVVYFAGHGEMVEKTGLGYWIPSDADASQPQGWISNTDVSRALSRARSKQIAVFADSCYSGVFASETSMSQTVESASLEDLQRRRAVTVMSSGGDEPVADGGKAGHSVFAWNLLQQFDELQGWAPGAKVFAAVRKGVERELPQSPMYGASLAAGHEPGADFLFEGRAADPRKTSY